MRLQANGIEIEVDDQGPPDGEPLLMVMGLGMQLTGWPEALVHRLVGRGFRVIRLDNRDAGLSSGFDHLGVPNLAWAALRYAFRLPVNAPYSIADMAADTAGVIDALGLQRVHVCGASMGGMISQHLAAQWPDRVKSLTLMMTTSGARGLPQPPANVRRALLSRPDGRDAEQVVRHLERVMRLIGSPDYPAPADDLRGRLRAMVGRAWRPAGTARQLAAVAADGDRSALLAKIGAPTHVLHGQADPLVPVAAADDLTAKIGGATLEKVAGMGHDLPAELHDRFADAIERTAARAAA
jgi:pimeloyl-ACP methyl ester carboxylesterase